MQPIQLLAPDGSFVEDEVYTPYIRDLSDDVLRSMYRSMVTARRLDNEATSLQRQGQLELWVPSLGQEAGQAGLISALRGDDMIFPSYREHVMALHRGVTPKQLIRQFRAAAHSGWDPADHAFNVYTVVLGAQTLHAAGWAMGLQRDQAAGRATDELVVACFGDGASSQGDVHESMGFASSYDLPVLYFIQNNHWAISVPAATQSKHSLAMRGQGYGIEGVQVDGNDVLASFAVATHHAAAVRQGRPQVIEAVTYRMGAHTTADDPTKYRTAEEVERWKAKDPISRYATWLEAAGHADAAWFSEVEVEAKDLAADLRKAVPTIEPLELERIFDTVYTEPHRQVEVEKAWLKDYEAGFAEEELSPEAVGA